MGTPGVAYLFEISVHLVEDCSAFGCDFVVFRREVELQSFYSALLISSPLIFFLMAPSEAGSSKAGDWTCASTAIWVRFLTHCTIAETPNLFLILCCLGVLKIDGTWKKWHDILIGTGSLNIHMVWTLQKHIYIHAPHLFFRAAPEAYGSSQARDQIRAADTCLHYSHSIAGS